MYLLLPVEVFVNDTKIIKHNKHFALRDNNSESISLLFLKNIPLTH